MSRELEQLSEVDKNTISRIHDRLMRESNLYKSAYDSKLVKLMSVMILRELEREERK